ncbi:capping protein regulator and myosin 1 linker 1 leucine rich repeat protein isoform X2 [Dermacentor variabilis]|uniref:capping protein regulator and myosin 1 linker 1 leucine rich repeat protein isoform X2 n=1 Tax=Dermacentor variabilis TaxID=34621 RepID=UPI003F5B690B
MSTKNAITKELSDSIRHVLDRSAKVSFKCMVRLEIKQDKTENRVLAFSSCRFFILTAKVPTKIEHSFHYLEIQTVESKKPNQLCLTIDNKVYTFYSVDPESSDVDHMIIQLGTAVKSIFPQVPLELIIRRVEAVPAVRLQPMLDFNQSAEASDPGPCGNFSAQYICMCDFHGLPFREDVAWDVDTIYLSHDTKELSLLDFDHLEGRDLVPIISALCYNAWFTKFRASNVKLASEALEQVLQVMKRSVSLEELYLDNTGIKWEFAHKLSMTLIANPNSPLNSLDLSNNLIEDKGLNSLCGIIAKITQGVGQLCGPLGKLHKGLSYLNLAHTGITAKGVNTLAHALSLNRCMPSNLTYLNLSDNVFKDDINNLYNYLAQPNSLVHLDLSGTECALETVFGALLRGCTQKLEVLNLSRNMYSSKKSKEVLVPPSFKTFFSSTVALRHLNMANVRMPMEALKAMLLGLACNEILTEVWLDLSCNDLKTQGALVLESCLPGIRCLYSLDISENNFDQDLANIVAAVGKNQSIKRLSIGRNFTNMKTKHVTRVMEAVVQLIQEKDSSLEYLSLADSKLRGELCLVINALGSNQCLTSIDITGNYMGLNGAKTLAKALQINSKLKTILWDRNSTPAQGFQDIAYALEKHPSYGWLAPIIVLSIDEPSQLIKNDGSATFLLTTNEGPSASLNFTLRYMPCPVVDITLAMKIAPERTETAWKKISELLHRNVSPKKHSNSQAFRLQQGFLLSSTQQMVDRWMLHLQDVIRTAQASSSEDVTCDEEVLKAEGYLKDASSAKQLLTRLHDVVLQQEEAGNPIEIKLQGCVDEMEKTLNAYLKGTASNMLKCIEDQCPTIMSDEKVRREIEDICRSRQHFPQEVLQRAILDQAGTDVLNRISEINLTIAAHVSDRILDEVIESLPRSHRDLVEKLNRQRSSTPDVLRSGLRPDSHSGDTHCDQDSVSESSDSPLATPKLPMKRKSINCRKLRPQSVVDSVEGIAADDIPDLLPKGSENSLPNLSPTSEKLEHLGKARPKRPKTHAPTRPCLQAPESREPPLAEGLDCFFKRHPSTSTPTLSPDSEDAGLKSDSSTSASSSILITESKPLEKSPSDNKETEKRSFMKGISSLFSRASSSSSESVVVQKSKQESKDTGSNIMSSSISAYSSVKSRHDADVHDKENGEMVTEVRVPETTKISGMEKFGVGPGSVILAEMKALQGKRTSGGAPTKGSISEDKGPGPVESPKDTGPFPSVRLKPTGLAESLRSPTEYYPREKSCISPSENVPSSPQLSTPGSSPKTVAALKSGRPPPPVAPKPRPKSMVGTMESRLSGEFSSDEGLRTRARTPDEADSLDNSNKSSEGAPWKRVGIYSKDSSDGSLVSSTTSTAASRAAFFAGSSLRSSGMATSSLAKEKAEGESEGAPSAPPADDIVDV